MSILVAMLIIVFLVVNRGKFVPLLRVLGSVFANNRVCSSHFRRRKGRRKERGGGEEEEEEGEGEEEEGDKGPKKKK
jgi:hypothetical protein